MYSLCVYMYTLFIYNSFIFCLYLNVIFFIFFMRCVQKNLSLFTDIFNKNFLDKFLFLIKTSQIVSGGYVTAKFSW